MPQRAVAVRLQAAVSSGRARTPPTRSPCAFVVVVVALAAPSACGRCRPASRARAQVPPAARPWRTEAKVRSPAGCLDKQLLVKRLSDRATLPTKGSPGAAGLDLFAAVPVALDGSEATVIIPPHGRALIKTDLAIKFDHIDVGPGCGLYARVAPRSSLAWKQHVGVGAGVVDSDYRGNVGVVLFNHSPSEPLVVRQGDRVAQLILERYESGVEVVEVAGELDETPRGMQGFGSTGK